MVIGERFMNKMMWGGWGAGILLLAALFLLAGCGDDESAPMLEVTAKSGKKVDINGTWITDCHEADGAWRKKTLAFTGTDFSMVNQSFLTDSTCGGGSKMDINAEGTLALGLEGDVTFGPSQAITTQVNYTVTTLTATANTDETAHYNGLLQLYGYEIWVAGEPQDILNLAEDGTTIDSSLIKDRILVDDGVNPNKLYKGDLSSVGADGYPTTIEVFIVYEKY